VQVMQLLLLMSACSRTESAIVQEDDGNLDWIHGYRSKRADVANSALKTLVVGRSQLRSTELDDAIRSTILVACNGADEQTVRIIRRSDIDRILPNQAGIICESFFCGGCYTYLGGQILAVAFATRPQLQPRLPDETQLW